MRSPQRLTEAGFLTTEPAPVNIPIDSSPNDTGPAPMPGIQPRDDDSHFLAVAFSRRIPGREVSVPTLLLSLDAHAVGTLINAGVIVERNAATQRSNYDKLVLENIGVQTGLTCG